MSAAGETWTSNEDVSGLRIDVCLPAELNIHTANAEQLAAIEAMSDDDYRAAVQAYCSNQVENALTGLIGVLTGSDQRACDNVTAICVATPANEGRATLVNDTCNDPCAEVECNESSCPACDVNEACEDQELRQGRVHPEQCKCTRASGCGVTSENVCTVPTWAPDPPETAVGWLARNLSQPSDVVIDRSASQATVSATVDPGFPCGSDSDSATATIGGRVTLFGTPCPGEECEMLLEVGLEVSDIRLDFDLGLVCGSAFAEANGTSITAGGIGIPIALGTDGCGVLAPGDLRLMASSIVNLDGDVERQTFDAVNAEPVSLCVDFANNTFEMPSATLSLAEGSVTMNLSGSIINQPPFAVAGEEQVVECDQPLAANIVLDGTASSDPDGPDDFRTFVWWQGQPLDPAAQLGFGPVFAAVSPIGTSDYHLTVSDLRFATMASRTAVTVVDTTPPSITAAVTPDELWPPNHKLVEHTVEVNVEDVCDPAASFVLTSIVSNEPDNDTGDGNTVDDIQEAEFGTPDTTFLLRAERKGNGSGRSYTITYTATDSFGNSETASTVVNVPHDRGN